MKTIKLLVALFIMAVALPTQAQTADEILDSYFENTGGADAWKDLKATKMSASITQGGMDIPVTMINTKEGKSIVFADFQGQKIVIMAFDGENVWNTNQMTMQPEMLPKEMADNAKLQANDFPDPFLGYKEKGYTVEYVGPETKEGTEVHKIKLVQEPVMVNGVEEQAVTYYFFETENNVPIMTESSAGGQTVTSSMSDYQEVDGLYFPFAMTVMGGMPLTIKEIELNPEIDPSIFVMPTAEGTDKK